MAKTKAKRVKVSTIEGLAGMIADLTKDVQIGFDSMDARFDKVEAELGEIKRTLDRMDTRLAALELAVFGASASQGGRLADSSILERLSKLEHVVFRK